MASASLVTLSVGSGKGCPVASIPAPPKGCLTISKSKSVFLAIDARTSKPASMISGPIPSPARATIFFVMVFSFKD